METKIPEPKKIKYIISCPSTVRKKYYQLFQHSELLIEKQKEGEDYIPTFSRLLCDIFCSLYIAYPRLNNWEDIEPRYLINMTVLEGLIDTHSFKKIRDKACYSEATSLWATELFAEKLLKSLSKRKIRKKFKKFDEENTPETEIDENGEKKKKKRKKSLFGWFPFTMPVSQEKSKKADVKKEVDDIKKKVGSLSLRATHSVAKEIDSFKNLIDICHGWNTKENNLNNMSYQEKMALANKIKSNSKMLELAKIIGHIRQLALSTRYSKVKELPHEIYNVVLGDDLLKIHPMEITYLSHPSFQYDFYQRLASKKLMQYELKGRETAGQGTIIACLDTSGSMSGKPEVMSKSVALGLLEIARTDNRNFIGIVFGQRNKVKTFIFKREEVEIHVPNEDMKTIGFIQGLTEFAMSFIGGGTDFETPLRTAFSFRQKSDLYKDADIVFVTDDICDMSTEFMKEYNKLKKVNNFRTYGILIGPKHRTPATLRKFCDEVMNFHTFTEDIAESLFARVSVHRQLL